MVKMDNIGTGQEDGPMMSSNKALSGVKERSDVNAYHLKIPFKHPHHHHIRAANCDRALNFLYI